MSRDANKCQNASETVFKRFSNLLVSVISLILSGKEFQAAGPAWLKQRSPSEISNDTKHRAVFATAELVVAFVGRPYSWSAHFWAL